MQWRGCSRWGRAGAVAAGLGWLLAGCGSSDAHNEAVEYQPPEYIFGGQTGSLVPTCGVAPLSRARAVPAGDALAVLYTSGCPEESLARLSLTGPGAENVGVQLEPLAASGAYLVRVNESLAPGEYQLGLPDRGSSTLAVAEAPAALPVQLGRIAAVSGSGDCGSDVRFEWSIEPDALAYAPLLRLWVRIDGGAEQLWVDYGALEVSAETSEVGLRLPRCGPSGCLPRGAHRLEVRAEVAGEALQPEPLEASFELGCADAEASRIASSETSSSSGCSMSGSEASCSWASLISSALVGLGWRKRRQQTRSRPPRSR